MTRDASPHGRDRLLTAALAAFARRGVDGASTRAIAADAGVSQALIVHHFGSKEGLWRAALDRAYAELDEAMARVVAAAAPATPAEALRAAARAFVRTAARQPDVGRIIVREAADEGPHVAWLVDTHVRPRLLPLLGLLRQALPDVAPERLRLLLIAFVGAASHLFSVPPITEGLLGLRLRTDADLDAFADLLLDRLVGLAPAPGPTHAQAGPPPAAR